MHVDQEVAYFDVHTLRLLMTSTRYPVGASDPDGIVEFAETVDDTVSDALNYGVPDDRSAADAFIAWALAPWLNFDEDAVKSELNDHGSSKWQDRGDSYKTSVLSGVDARADKMSTDGYDGDVPHWAVVKYAVETEIVDEDDLLEKTSDDATGTYDVLPSKLHYEATLEAIEELGVDHGWEWDEDRVDTDSDRDYYTVVEGYAPDGSDVFVDDAAFLIACIRAREDDAVPDESDVPDRALTPIVGPVDEISDDTVELGREVFHELTESEARKRFYSAGNLGVRSYDQRSNCVDYGELAARCRTSDPGCCSLDAPGHAAHPVNDRILKSNSLVELVERNQARTARTTQQATYRTKHHDSVFDKIDEFTDLSRETAEAFATRPSADVYIVELFAWLGATVADDVRRVEDEYDLDVQLIGVGIEGPDECPGEFIEVDTETLSDTSSPVLRAVPDVPDVLVMHSRVTYGDVRSAVLDQTDPSEHLVNPDDAMLDPVIRNLLVDDEVTFDADGKDGYRQATLEELF